MPSVRRKPSLEVFRLRLRLAKLASTALNMTLFFRAQAVAARPAKFRNRAKMWVMLISAPSVPKFSRAEAVGAVNDARQKLGH